MQAEEPGKRHPARGPLATLWRRVIVLSTHLPVANMSKHECPDCSDRFETKAGLNSHRSRMHTPPWRDEDTLREQYIAQKKTIAEMADEMDVSPSTILGGMRKSGIEPRNKWMRTDTVPYHHFHKTHDTVGGEYECADVKIDYKVRRVFIHRLIAVAIGELEPSEFFDPEVNVHHESGHGLDNRHGNLTRMGHADHKRMHAKDRERDSAGRFQDK